MSSIAESTLEIRAPVSQVEAFVQRASAAAKWIWPKAQVEHSVSERELPCGTYQLIVADGDKLRTKVDAGEDGAVLIEAEYRPRRKEVPGRILRYELNLERGAGTCRATLGVAMDGASAGSELERRKWRRNAEQCLERLAEVAEPELKDQDVEA